MIVVWSRLDGSMFRMSDEGKIISVKTFSLQSIYLIGSSWLSFNEKKTAQVERVRGSGENEAAVVFLLDRPSVIQY